METLERIKNKEKARQKIKGNYLLMAIIFIAMIGTTNSSNYTTNLYTGGTLSLLLVGALSLILIAFLDFLKISCIVYASHLDRSLNFDDIPKALNFNIFGKFILMEFNVGIRVFIGFALFIIPGIIWGIKYSPVLFDVIENPDLESEMYLLRAETMMMGEKWNYFYMNLTFFGWAILTILTFGIAGFYYYPYQSLAQYYFYKNRVEDIDKKLEGKLFI